MEEFKVQLEEYQKLLPVGKSVSFTEAERRAGRFLEAMALITNWRHEFGKEKIKLLSVQTAVFASEMSKGTAKTVTENKLMAESSETYEKAREEFEHIENDLSYLKAYYDIFSDAHIFYRQLAKGEMV